MRRFKCDPEGKNRRFGPRVLINLQKFNDDIKNYVQGCELACEYDETTIFKFSFIMACWLIHTMHVSMPKKMLHTERYDKNMLIEKILPNIQKQENVHLHATLRDKFF